MKLNKEQKDAVRHMDGPCIVTAVPGSGKTRTLTSRVIHLVQEGVNPKNILCLTFTNKAAEEMRSRVAKHIGQNADRVWISTFHSLCVAVLRKFGNLIGLSPSFSIYDDKDQRELLSKLSRMYEYECGKYEVYDMAKISNDFREDLVEFSDIAGPLNPLQANIIDEYIKTLDEFDAVDFSGLLSKTHLLLKEHEDVSQRLGNKFKYILVDEAQDTNKIQYEIVKLIGYHKNVFVVGDLQQSIFGWRGARPDNLEHMKNDFGEVEEIVLHSNYRSTAKILLSAENLIHHNNNAKKVKLVAERGDGHDVVIIPCYTPEDEAARLAQRIVHLKHHNNYNWSDFAVLYRENRLSKTIEMVFQSENIPYKITGGFSFFDRSEIKTAMSYFSFLANPKDTISFARAVQNPRRKIGDIAIGKLERLCKSDEISMIDACNNSGSIGLSKEGQSNLKAFISLFEKHRSLMKNFSVGKVCTGLIMDSGYYSYIQQMSQQDPDFQKKIDNLDEFLSGIEDFASQNPSASLSDYLHNIQLSSDNDNKDGNEVNLMTMHSAKGTEYPVVCIIAAETDIIPHKRSIAENGEEEERRLFYVATTRAKDRLYISYCESRRKFRKKISASYPTPFLKEMNIVV